MGDSMVASKAARQRQRDLETAAALESELFGHASDALSSLGREGASTSASPQLDAPLAWHEDRGGAAPAAPKAGGKRPALWEDPADAGVEVRVSSRAQLRRLRHSEEEAKLGGETLVGRLREQHRRLNPRTAWAEAGKGGAQAPASRLDAVLRSANAEAVLSSASTLLPAGSLETTRLRDANASAPCQGVVQALDWHPNGQLLLTASLDKHVRFFSVDGTALGGGGGSARSAPCVQSIYLQDLPVHSAGFACGGRKVLVTGRRSYAYVLDLESAKVERLPGPLSRGPDPPKSLEKVALCAHGDLAALPGEGGATRLLSLRTRAAAGTLAQSGSVRSAAFDPEGRALLTAGGDGVVCLWDLRTQTCRARLRDEGSSTCTALAASSTGGLAAGSGAGVVNLYSWKELDLLQGEVGLGGLGSSDGAPNGPRSSDEEARGALDAYAALAPAALAPQKALAQLTTTVDSLAFSGDGQMLVWASRMKRDALRVAHVASGSAFANWPTSKSPLGYVHCLGLSPSSAYLAVGNAKGRVLLYRMHHYSPVLGA